jgi:hypothetical protein
MTLAREGQRMGGQAADCSQVFLAQTLAGEPRHSFKPLSTDAVPLDNIAGTLTAISDRSFVREPPLSSTANLTCFQRKQIVGSTTNSYNALDACRAETRPHAGKPRNRPLSQYGPTRATKSIARAGQACH